MRTTASTALDLIIVGSSAQGPVTSLDIARQVRRAATHLPIILIARNSSEQLAIDALLAGVTDYFPHPVSFDEVASSVKRLAKAASPGLKNSWGTGWGEQGFFCIAYGECGIDTWRNHGVAGIRNTGWQSNRRVTGLWAIDQDRNAWAHFDGLGWRKISPDNDNILVDMLVHLAAAKAAARPVNFYEEQSVIKQVYVF